jgi:DNA-binding NarL/FixJ family response regulator
MHTFKAMQVDDYRERRLGLHALLKQTHGCEVVPGSVNTDDASEMARLHGPDLVVLDLSMPDIEALDLIERLVDQNKGLKVVLLTVRFDGRFVNRAIRAGARGLVVKPDNDQELIHAIKVVNSGQLYISPIASSSLAKPWTLPIAGHVDNTGSLTSRQQQVLRLIALSESPRSIARELRISPKTVESHRSQIMNRLKIHDIAGLVRYAIRVGLISASTDNNNYHDQER